MTHPHLRRRCAEAVVCLAAMALIWWVVWMVVDTLGELL